MHLLNGKLIQYRHHDERAIRGIDNLDPHIGDRIVLIHAWWDPKHGRPICQREIVWLADVRFVSKDDLLPCGGGNTPIKSYVGGWVMIVTTEHGDGTRCLSDVGVIPRGWQSYRDLSPADMERHADRFSPCNYVVSYDEWMKCPAYWTVNRSPEERRWKAAYDFSAKWIYQTALPMHGRLDVLADPWT